METISNGVPSENVPSLVELGSRHVHEHVPTRPRLDQEKTAVDWDLALKQESASR